MLAKSGLTLLERETSDIEATTCIEQVSTSMSINLLMWKPARNARRLLSTPLADVLVGRSGEMPAGRFRQVFFRRSCPAVIYGLWQHSSTWVALDVGRHCPDLGRPHSLSGYEARLNLGSTSGVQLWGTSCEDRSAGSGTRSRSLKEGGLPKIGRKDQHLCESELWGAFSAKYRASPLRYNGGSGEGFVAQAKQMLFKAGFPSGNLAQALVLLTLIIAQPTG